MALKDPDYSKAGLRVGFIARRLSSAGICSFSTCEALCLDPAFQQPVERKHQLEDIFD